MSSVCSAGLNRPVTEKLRTRVRADHKTETRCHPKSKAQPNRFLVVVMYRFRRRTNRQGAVMKTSWYGRGRIAFGALAASALIWAVSSTLAKGHDSKFSTQDL